MKRNKMKLMGRTFFKKFSRKSYAVFNSMRGVVHISNLVLAYSLIVSPLKATAQDDSVSFSRVIDIEEIEVVGQMSPAISEELPRLVTVISSAESECAPLHSITDLLRYSGNIDLRQRGKSGIQSDLSIRGGSFDHSLILLNGINISDPQTGHLSLNLPIETESIHHLEILNGSASRVHGANAFSGALNFVTKPADINSLTISTAWGQYHYLNNSVTLNLGCGSMKNLLHYNNAYSSGYTVNTDYFRQGLFFHNQTEIGEDQIEVQLGYNTRSFGSNSFYTPKYPDQYESNQLMFLTLGYKTGGKIKVNPQAYWRRHRDRWEMFREDDNWYRVEDGKSISNDTSLTTFDTSFVYTNHHLNDVYGLKLNLSTRSKLGATSMGWHFRSENILSTNIGYEHNREVSVRGFEGVNYTLSDKRSIFDMHLEQTLSIWRFYFSGGLLINWNSYLPEKLNYFPGIDLKFRIVDRLNFVGSYNYTLGIPTFTDLTYNDPNNQGNEYLKPYSQESGELGLKWFDKTFLLSSVVFLTAGENVIDWVWFEDDMRFKPVNTEWYSSRGIEFSGKFKAVEGTLIEKIVSSAQINFTAIRMDKNVPGEVLKYFNIRKKSSLILQSKPVKNLILAINFSYTEREGNYLSYDFGEGEYKYHPFEPYFLTDIRISYQLKSFNLFVEASNLFDENYIDIGSISQPGRWLSAGLKYSVQDF